MSENGLTAFVGELTDIVASAAGDPTLSGRTWVLITESPDGGWGIRRPRRHWRRDRPAARAELSAVAQLATERRRADAGEDPGQALVRPEGGVEGYEQ